MKPRYEEGVSPGAFAAFLGEMLNTKVLKSLTFSLKKSGFAK